MSSARVWRGLVLMLVVSGAGTRLAPSVAAAAGGRGTIKQQQITDSSPLIQQLLRPAVAGQCCHVQVRPAAGQVQLTKHRVTDDNCHCTALVLVHVFMTAGQVLCNCHRHLQGTAVHTRFQCQQEAACKRLQPLHRPLLLTAHLYLPAADSTYTSYYMCSGKEIDSALSEPLMPHLRAESAFSTCLCDELALCSAPASAAAPPMHKHGVCCVCALHRALRAACLLPPGLRHLRAQPCCCWLSRGVAMSATAAAAGLPGVLTPGRAAAGVTSAPAAPGSDSSPTEQQSPSWLSRVLRGVAGASASDLVLLPGSCSLIMVLQVGPGAPHPLPLPVPWQCHVLVGCRPRDVLRMSQTWPRHLLMWPQPAALSAPISVLLLVLGSSLPFTSATSHSSSGSCGIHQTSSGNRQCQSTGPGHQYHCHLLPPCQANHHRL